MLDSLKRKTDAAEVARALRHLTAGLLKSNMKHPFPKSSRKIIESRMRLYLDAAVLMQLREAATPEAQEVQDEFERLILPAKYDDAAAARVAGLDAAMRDLHRLIAAFGSGATLVIEWAHLWFAEAGIATYNPAELTLVAADFADSLAAVASFLRNRSFRE